MNDQQPALPPILADNLGSVARILLGGAAMWLVQKGVITNDQTTQFVSLGAGMVVAVGALAWAWAKNRYFGKKAVAAAATGDPQADPAAPSTQAAVANAIASQTSPITAATP